MYLSNFTADGFRSLSAVRIDELSPFNVFYGPNGAGKSNILLAIGRMFDWAAIAAKAFAERHHADAVQVAGSAAYQEGLVNRDDLSFSSTDGIITLGGVLHQVAVPTGTRFDTLELEVELLTLPRTRPTLSITKLHVKGHPQGPSYDLRRFMPPGKPSEDELRSASDDLDLPAELNSFRAVVAELLMHGLPDNYHMIGADRMPSRHEGNVRLVESRMPTMHEHLKRGDIARALLTATISREVAVRDALADFRDLMSGPPLLRPRFDAVGDAQTQDAELRERVADHPEHDVALNLKGLGVFQLYSILAQAVLSNAKMISIEEPEAHLHAPSTGLQLRELLQRVVNNGTVSQIFIATHSNLFDLHPTHYFDASLVNGVTVVARKSVEVLDRAHLYEPGPARHALEKLLRYASADEVVFRRSEDGSAVTAGSMLELLAKRDPVATQFLEDLTGAALRVMRLKTGES